LDEEVTVLKVFTPKDPTGPAIVAVLLIGIVMVVMFWREIAAGGVGAAVVVGTWVVLAVMAWRASRTMADRKIVVDGSMVELVKGTSSKRVDLSSVESLEQRRVKSGRTSYTAFLARLGSGELVELFADGQFSDQDGLKTAIADAAGKPWTTC
jgi:predicted membrane metal-binding protein